MLTISIDIFYSKMKEVIEKEISEIIKIDKQNYLLKISAEWHQVIYINKYGMVLQLRSGQHSSKLLERIVYESETLHNGTKLRKKGDAIFELLEKRYLTQLFFYNNKIIDTIGRYYLLIEKCEKIEKKSEKLFVLLIRDIEYVFDFKESYDPLSRLLNFQLEIKFSVNGEYRINKIDGLYRINEILSVLNLVYYLNISAVQQIPSLEINKIFGL